MKRVIRFLLKAGLLVTAFLVIAATAVVLYLSSPKLINKTLPVWLKVESAEQHAHPRYAGAISFEELTERYSFTGNNLGDIKAFAESEGIRLKHQGHIVHRLTHKGPDVRDGKDIPEFDNRLLGYQILALKQFPDPSTDLIISEHSWFDYFLVIEIVSD